ncbi:neutral/alkaline non-lysosomal ceramidase N-terminal domain-containing protein [Sporosarcina sp. resist]|uniref:neutral/alkaline non-lysosomal ceramidase N-terminal domain-containing protein n=1 Tax=Sporosarcina sp. resist TaxID=2762563 RepID=UPI00164D46EF|nr:neutral/alkaline non-lysosomal ceramidase N-terminal domain-containing protein [Sporosarcina sp. resist]QNK89383.1 neutral/alkaline non-lysosomal ceramidase N-terminal domain-containing protein [Sporosarcina sp. resist]
MSKVGVYRVDITPPLGIDFIGYHRPTGISNIDERIYATAFIFESKETKSVIISIDNIGMLIKDTIIIREQIVKELKIPFENITVVYTHTHSGPATASNNQMVQSYKTSLITNVVKATVHANENMQPSEVGWNVTMGEIGVNRREISLDGKVKMGINVNGVVDNRIGVLAIKHPTTGKFQGLIVFCTAHPNVLKGDSDILSADYPGLTRDILQNTLHCPVIIIQGAAGNVNANYRGSKEALGKIAYALSGSVLTMIPSINYKSISKLRTVSTKMSMKLKDIPEPDVIKRMALLAEEQWGVNTDKWLMVLLGLHKQNIKQLSIDLEIQLLQINEGSFSGIPMEPFSETALDIQKRLKNKLAFFGGYTNGYLGYLPTKEAYPYGGYEVEVNPVIYGPITDLWMPPVDNTAEQVVKKVLELYNTK